MAHDDRDLNLEKTLARHFRDVAPGTPSPLPVTPPSTCPDAETLAAYHEGSLSDEERALWKSHVVSCEDCQVVLAHLATPLETSVGEESLESVLAATPVSAYQSAPADVAHVVAVPRSSTSQSAAPAVAAATPVPIMHGRKAYRSWVFRAAAVAAGLLIWIAFREPRPVPQQSPAAVEVADNRPVVSPAPPNPSSPAEGDTDQLLQKQSRAQNEKKAFSSAQPGGVPAALPRRVDRVDADKQPRSQAHKVQQDSTASRASTKSESPLQHAASPSHGPALTLEQQQRQQASATSAGAAGAALLDKKSAGSQAGARLAKNARDAGKSVQPAPPVPQEPSFLSADAVAPANATPALKSAAAPPPPQPAPPAQPPAADKAKSAIAAETNAVGGVSSAITVEASAVRLRSVAAQGPQTFSTPDNKVFWRVGAAGSVEYSADRGSTWAPQSTGVNADLTTGAAPASKVCWVVGRSGMILRTVDSGATWVKISPPVTADFIAVRSNSAFRATIWFVDDPKTGATKGFQTTDGGVTWSSAPND